MGRRSRDTDVGSMFGSDSFLDVVANIVGILIILIVLVGVRVRHSAPSQEAKETQTGETVAEARAAWEKERAAIESANRAAKEEYEAKLTARNEAEARALEERGRIEQEQRALDVARDAHEAERKKRLEILRAYEQEARQLEGELSALAEQLDMARRAKSEAEAKVAQETAFAVSRVQESTAKAGELERTIAAAKGEFTLAKTSGAELTRQILALRKDIEEVKRDAPAVKPIRHYPTPLSRRVQLEELHFRCKNKRVAYTYLNELSLASIDQAKSRFTPSTNRVDGIAGPMGGFRLKYSFQRAGGSVTQQLAGGSPFFQVMAMAELAADSDMVGETKEEVVEANSALRVKLRSTPATTHAVTLWVYPDSFELAKVVEELLHEGSYTVGLRPLPEGFPIISSSFGSRTDSH